MVTKRRSEYAAGIRAARKWAAKPGSTRWPQHEPGTGSSFAAGVRRGLFKEANARRDPWEDHRRVRAAKALRQHSVSLGGPNGPSSFNVRTGRVKRTSAGPVRAGRNTGSFKTRAGGWRKGKGGRFVGSKG